MRISRQFLTLAVLLSSMSAFGQSSHPHWTVKHFKETCGTRRDGKPLTKEKEETIAICAAYVVGVVDGLDQTYQVWPTGPVYQVNVFDYEIAELLDDCIQLAEDLHYDPDASASGLINEVLHITGRADWVKVEKPKVVTKK
jgi:hypothetical protein